MSVSDMRSSIMGAIQAHPELNDREIAKLLKWRWWSDVRDIRRSQARAIAVAAPLPAPPPAPAVTIEPRRRTNWEDLSDVIRRMILRQQDEAEKYQLRLALLRVRWNRGR
ncbi:MAG: hypothetical protein WCJ76_08770 [Comamonadaceae bacterium]